MAYGYSGSSARNVRASGRVRCRNDVVGRRSAKRPSVPALVVHRGEEVGLGEQVAEREEHALGAPHVEQEVVDQGDPPRLHRRRLYATARTLRPVRIAVDARALLAGRGVARYVRRLLAALAEQFPDDDWHAFVPGREPVEVPEGVTPHRHPLGGRAVFGAASILGRPPIDLLCDGADVVWIPAPGAGRARPRPLRAHDPRPARSRTARAISPPTSACGTASRGPAGSRATRRA